MDLSSTKNSIMKYDLKKHCHINSNEDGDRFVGIKGDSDNAMVYFPIGYELPKNDAEIRTDINHLIQVLSEFTTKDDRLLATNKFDESQTVDFPINAYKNVIEYYFSVGGTYYVEKEQLYITASSGKVDWARTARKQMPLVQSRNGISSFIFIISGPIPSIGEITPFSTWYCPLNSLIFSIAATSLGSSTTHITLESLFGLEHMLHGSLSVMLQHIEQYLISLFASKIAFDSDSTSLLFMLIT